jgi:Chaperone of endosialidase
MASTYTTNKKLELPGNNDYVNTWNVPVNNDFTFVDTALGGVTSINATGTSGTITLTDTQYRPPFIEVTGAPSADVYYSIPSGTGGQWTVYNGTSTFAVYMVSAAGGSAVRIPRGYRTIVSCDGSATGMRLSINTLPSPAGSDTQVQYNSSGAFAGSSNLTFNGTTLTANAITVASGGLGVGSNIVVGNQPGGPTYYSYTIGASPGGFQSIFQFYNDGTYAGARFVVGTSFPGVYEFKNTGEATASGSWVSLSDRRIKDNQQRIQNSLGRVARLTGLTYTRNDITQMNGEPIVSAGLLAQDVAAVLPEAVSIAGPAPASDPDGPGLMALNYDAVVALLVNAVNELSAKVDALEARG